MMEPRDEIKK